MSDDDDGSRVTISLFLPWIAVAIGGISGWLAEPSMEGIVIGCLMGIIVSAITYFGMVPVVGMFIYHIFVSLAFGWMGMSFPVLYWYGMVISIIFTCITTVLLFLLVASLIGR